MATGPASLPEWQKVASSLKIKISYLSKTNNSDDSQIIWRWPFQSKNSVHQQLLELVFKSPETIKLILSDAIFLGSLATWPQNLTALFWQSSFPMFHLTTNQKLVIDVSILICDEFLSPAHGRPRIHTEPWFDNMNSFVWWWIRLVQADHVCLVKSRVCHHLNNDFCVFVSLQIALRIS